MHPFSRFCFLGCSSLLFLLSTGCNPANTGNPSTVPQNMANSARQMAPANAERQITSSQAVANRVARVTHVRSASVLVMNRTAYVAVEMKPGASTHLTQKTKDSIIRTVKANHTDINNVMVTANPDTYQQFRSYAKEVSQGRPVTGIWNRFNAVVQRTWPNGR